MVCNLNEGRIYKGSNAEVTVPVYPRCFTGDTSDMVVSFYTTVGGNSVEFSQTADTISITGINGTVVFQPVELDTLDDGLLKCNVSYTYEGSAYTKDLETRLYIKTPDSYTPIKYITEDNVQEVVDGIMTAFTPTTGFTTINGSAITEGGNMVLTAETRNYSAGTNIDITDDVISVTGITVPTKTSQLTNDSGFITDISGKQDVLVSGANIKTINNQSILGSGDLSITAGRNYTAGTNISIVNDVISVTGITSYTGITSLDVTTALGYTPVSSSTITSIWYGSQAQ